MVLPLTSRVNLSKFSHFCSSPVLIHRLGTIAWESCMKQVRYIPVVSNAWWAPNECSLSYGWEHSMELSFPVSSWDKEERQGEKTPSFLNLPCSWIKGTWTVIRQSINEHWQCSYGDLCEGEINGHTIYLLVGRPLILPLSWPSDLWLQVASH